MITDKLTRRKHLKPLLPIAIAISLVACGGSSSDEPDVLADVPMDADPTPAPDPSAPDTGTEITPVETALETASRVDIPRYDLVIENVRAVVNATEFTSENYVSAVAAIAESSEAKVVYDHIDFLSLLERQVITEQSPLTPLDVNEAELTENQSSINRVHACPDGGRLLATKVELTDRTDLSGTFSFDECQIGEILIDGGYSIRSNSTEDDILADVNLGIRINGVDGVSTSLSGSILNTVIFISASTDGDTFTNKSLLNTTTTVTVPTGVVLTMEVAVLSTQIAETDDASPTDILADEAYTVAMGNVRAWVDDDNNARLSDTTTTGTELTKSLGNNTFEQGEIDFYLLPNTNELTVKADNGDPSSFDAFVTTQDSSVISFVVPWDSNDYVFGPQGKRIPLILPPTIE